MKLQHGFLGAYGGPPLAVSHRPTTFTPEAQAASAAPPARDPLYDWLDHDAFGQWFPSAGIKVKHVAGLALLLIVATAVGGCR